ncbi:hypothetical protein [Burkholderia metallica]|uniref:hypothetical protein n=1 Tax=Burkholderia metallica TaxID=488729 RepID=UPI0020C6563C|nr:hypothetical protein [Burkholderia metallica]
MKTSCTCCEKAVGCVSAGGLPGAVETSEAALWRCLHRIARSHRFRTGQNRAAGNRSAHRTACVVLIAEPVKTRGIAVLARRMIATAGIDASGIVGAYFESGQPWRLHFRHSIFVIIENGGLRQERETLRCVNNHGLRGYPVRNRAAGWLPDCLFEKNII